MPSFDAVSEVDKHELTNAVDQASRDLGNRYDLRGTDARFELEDKVITQYAPTEHQLDQLLEMLKIRLAGRHIDLRAVEVGEVLTNLAGSRREITIKQGLEQAQAKKIIARIKEAKLKVDCQINGEKLRINSKKRDDLQTTIAFLRKAELAAEKIAANHAEPSRYPLATASDGIEAILAGLDRTLGAGKPTAASIRTSWVC